MMEWIIFTDADLPGLEDMNEGTDMKVRPRPIDQAAHPRAGDHAAPARVVQGEYEGYWAPRLAGHDRIIAEPDEIFVLEE